MEKSECLSINDDEYSSDSETVARDSSLDIDDSNSLLKDIGALCGDKETSDVILIVEDTRFYGHKLILATRCDYFRVMFYGGMKESIQTEIELKGSTAVSFDFVFRYLYTGRMSLKNTAVNVILDILFEAHQYGSLELESSVSDYLMHTFDVDHVCDILDHAILFQRDVLANECIHFIDNYAVEILHHKCFLNLSAVAVKKIISRDIFYNKEVDIFKAIVRWIGNNPHTDYKDILSEIRLPLMTKSDIQVYVQPSKLFTSEFLETVSARIGSKKPVLNNRGCLVPNKNLGKAKLGCRLIKKINSRSLHSDDYEFYEIDNIFNNEELRHTIVMELDGPHVINHISLNMWDSQKRAYSYCIEVSVDQKYWFRLKDYKQYKSTSYEVLDFPARLMAYIRIVGTYSSPSRPFYMFSFGCSYTKKSTKKHLNVPNDNVESNVNCICAINYPVPNSDCSLEYQLGISDYKCMYKSLYLLLEQPKHVKFVRFLIWVGDVKEHDYDVDVGPDCHQWRPLKQFLNSQSWQYMYFPIDELCFVRVMRRRYVDEDSLLDARLALRY